MDVSILEGSQAILAHADLLEQLAERSGQLGAMNWLGFFLGGRGALWKRPYVVLCLQSGADASSLQLDIFLGAVLFFELNLLGVPTGVFSTDDWEGLRTVVADASQRHEVAARATEALLDRGAQVVVTTYACAAAEGLRAGPLLQRSGIMWAENDRLVTKSRLNLASSFEQTLTNFGAKTRTQLRYYRRRLEKELQCIFLPDSHELLEEEDLIRLAAISREHISTTECRRRYRAARDLPGGFLMAIRTPDGQLLSSLAGWRQGTTTVMYHQINASGYPKHSIGSVMRSYFIESEIQRGARTLIFYHGTNDTISHSFESDLVRDLVARRTSSYPTLLLKLLGLVVSPRRFRETHYLGGSTTFLASILASDALEWHPGPADKA